MRRTAPSLPATHDELVARLTADAPPVRRLWPPWARLLAWLAVATAVGVVAVAVGLRTDLAHAIRRPIYAARVTILCAAAVAAALAALRAAVPGRSDAPAAARLALVLAGAAAVTLCFEPTSAAASSLGAFVGLGLRCALCVAMFGALPWVALFVAVRRAAPVDGRAVGAWVGAAAFLIGAAAVRLACPVDDPRHLLVWHILPVAGWTALSSLAGAAYLVRWRRPRHASAR